MCWLHDIELHQIEKCSAAGEVLRCGACSLYRTGRVIRTCIIERAIRPSPSLPWPAFTAADDVRIGGAAAEIATHIFPDVRFRSRMALLHAGDGGENLARRAVSALERILIDERLLASDAGCHRATPGPSIVNHRLAKRKRQG